ncbi:GGDEF domain-containing protein [Devosia sp. Naph2]|uniref:GGDEF domain-containing protein n=1 Tax=Devosia polycyclovorans TaxID=3345148 RepID=UPI0035D0883F
MPLSKIFALPGWTSVGRWTVFGTLACAAASLVLTWLMFMDLESDVAPRILVASAALPIIIGAPLFFYFSQRLRGLAIANIRLGRVARTDGLTACLNRRAFTARVNAWLERPASSCSGALLMIDADNFKSINDLYGHDYGDEALTIIARAIRSVLRSGDFVGRMGGEEFAVFLPGVTQHQAQIVAERIRLSVIVSCFAPDGKVHPLSVSIGGAAFVEATSFAELFRIADQRLYSAKQAGRNAVVLDQPHEPPKLALRIA